MTKVTLGELKQVELRKIWSHEAHDFTNWLALESNLSALSSEIGISISLIETEASVGGFNVDILAEEENSGRKIVIENQLEVTNHDHLGKIITYASGYDAEIVIWVVKDAREEHKQAIEWLNEHTDDQTYFFLIKMEVWQIGDSAFAPKFNVLSEPNDWAKAIKSSTSQRSLTDTKLLQLEYWTKLVEYTNQNSKLKLSRKPRPRHWYDISIGSSEYHITLRVNQFSGEIKCTLYIKDNKVLFDEFFSKKEKIESKLGYELFWNRNEDGKASMIDVSTTADYQDTDAWFEQFEWLTQRANEFIKVFGKSPNI